jgi:hypothetical protein
MANTGVVIDGVVVTVCVDVCGPLHPVAVTVITDVPDHPATYVIVPIAALIVLPPARLAASRLYVILVDAVAVAV